MSQLSISRPLLLLLLLATVMTVVVVLRPDMPPVAVETELLAERSAPRSASETDASPAPWHRATIPVAAGQAVAGGLLPPTPPVLPVPAPVEPVVYVPAPKPVAPTPRFTYLGRLESDEGIRIFLAVGDAFESVKLGDVIDSAWRIKRITDEGVELEYLPLHETRWLALTR